MNLALDLCFAVHVGALMVWFGALSLQRMLGVVQPSEARRDLRIAGVVALASGLLWPLLQTGVVKDDALAALDPQLVWQLLTQSSFGGTWLVRVAIVLLAFLVTFTPLLETGRALYFLVASALASVALLGHAAGVTGTLGTVQRLTVALHLLAAGAWFGALPRLWMLAERLPVSTLAQILRRFSPYGMILVSIVVATGALSAWFRLGAIDPLFASAYGKILLLKVGLVALMGAVALNNRNRLTPMLERSDLLVQATARRRLRQSIGAEAALGLTVVMAAALLGSAEAPH